MDDIMEATVTLKEEQKMDISPPVTEMRLCCLVCDSRILRVLIRVLFSMIILIFCCYEISKDSDGCSNSLLSWYCSTIGIVLTAWVKGGSYFGNNENVSRKNISKI